MIPDLDLENEELKAWEVLDSSYELRTPWLKVRRDTCKLPDGSIIDDYYVIERQDIVGIIPITNNNEVVVNLQYKHGIAEIVREIPAGMIDAGEEPEAAARRELEEETGYQATELIKLGTMTASPTSQNNRYHIFLAPNVTPTGQTEDNPREIIKTELIPLSEIREKINSGYINVLWSVSPLCLALDWIEKKS